MRWYAVGAAAMLALSISLGYWQATRQWANDPPGLRGLSSLAPEVQARVRAALEAGDVPLPASLAALSPRTDTPRGPDSAAPAFRAIAPVGIAVATDKPSFTWSPAEGGHLYTLTIVDDQGRPVGPPIEVDGPAHNLQQALPRGRVFTWQVTADRGATRYLAPAPPMPPARFLVIDPATADRLSTMQRVHPDSRVLLGLLYVEAGAVLEGLSQFSHVEAGDPHAALARRMEARLGPFLDPYGARGSDRSAAPATPAPVPPPRTP